MYGLLDQIYYKAKWTEKYDTTTTLLFYQNLQ
jgi:hypothetical protein